MEHKSWTCRIPCDVGRRTSWSDMITAIHSVLHLHAITIEKTEALSTHVRTSPQDGLDRRAGQYGPFCPSRIAALGRGIRKKLSPKVRPSSFKATFACPARRAAWTSMWSSPTDVTYIIFPDRTLGFSSGRSSQTGTVSMTGVDLDSTSMPREISAAP